MDAKGTAVQQVCSTQPRSSEDVNTPYNLCQTNASHPSGTYACINIMNKPQEFSSLGGSKSLRLYWRSFYKYSNVAVTFRYQHSLWQIMTYQHIKGCCERFSGLKGVVVLYVDKHCFNDSTPVALTLLTAALTIHV